MSRLRVECYSGFTADERPERFSVGGRQYEVTELLDKWYSPDAAYFRVRAQDGNLYVLRHSTGDARDDWTLESFRRADSGPA